MGKSAQFPLHVWLPDAMEGPTPVSALIHAATMVNAGVYLVARANPIFASAPEAMVVVAAIGIFTAILAASIAMTQTDIKRVLAYSTLSQLGYMFAALGVGALDGGDLPPHDPRLLQGPAVPRLGLGDPRRPRGAGHAPDGRPGARRSRSPTRRCSSARWRSPGIPPLAGFFSKDEILGESFKLGFAWVWAIGVRRRGHDRVLHVPAHRPDVLGRVPRRPRRSGPKIHESPRVMTVPLSLLAIPSRARRPVAWSAARAAVRRQGEGLLASWLEPIFEEGQELLGATRRPYSARSASTAC